ncbi:hypothetical protein MCOR25_003685 [Pyricularia grisea]|uniref:Uncharacterized protein n=1 Tax=Pyricularia grisea TaxID=148305 RepID=A0A6P8B110_PYRGI|nr:uncharacterized protein PgNI_07330 [Pyricularia grisea]KAI6372525.1 hypothetical protein MCOR25_003685 [Pyricularia grisea]TLD08524.1 hypothetical protein PgNI_07330 [Pyricularia grisea]
MFATTMRLIPILLAGFLMGAQAQVALPTTLPAFTSIWFPGDIPGGPFPSKLEANVLIDNPGTTTWSFTTETAVAGATTTSGAPAPYWNSLGLKYASEGRVLTMDYTGGYALMHPASESMTWTGTQYSTFMHVQCTSIVSAATAKCEGSYGSFELTISSISLGGTTATGSTLGFQLTTPGVTQDLTALPVTVTKVSLATSTPTSMSTSTSTSTSTLTPTPTPTQTPSQTPLTTSSSGGGGFPRATQPAGTFAGAAALVGGVLMLF